MTEPAEHRAALLKAFNLGPEDLEANRSGKLSERQVRQLAASGMRNLVAALFAGVALAAILVFVAAKPLKPAQYITAGILFGAVLLVGIFDLRKTRAAGAEGRAERFTGPIQIRRQGKSGLFLHVADQSFRMPVRFWHLQNGGNYHVYVAPRAKRIVAIEPDE